MRPTSNQEHYKFQILIQNLRYCTVGRNGKKKHLTILCLSYETVSKLNFFPKQLAEYIC
jgi:hypothetical protein